MAKALAKGSRITGAQRATLASQYAKRYAAGESIRKIAEDAGRSFGFVHGVLKESGVSLRGRGGATRGQEDNASAGKTASVSAGQEGLEQEGSPAKTSATKASAEARQPAKTAKRRRRRPRPRRQDGRPRRARRAKKATAKARGEEDRGEEPRPRRPQEEGHRPRPTSQDHAQVERPARSLPPRSVRSLRVPLRIRPDASRPGTVCWSRRMSDPADMSMMRGGNGRRADAADVAGPRDGRSTS